MLGSLKRLALGVGLIILAAAVLLGADWGSRRHKPRAVVTLPSVALFQLNSSPILDDFCQGAIESLTEGGFVDGKTIQLSRFNAEGDVATANLISKQITDGSNRLLITCSTICLQTVASANKSGARTPHVFGAVTDPFIAGVGIVRGPPQQKPPYLTGMGTFQPVEDIFRTAKTLYPGLKTVGVVWNPAEVNSEACTRKGREVCQQLGITLIEAPIEKTSDVGEAAGSLVSRGVQAFWMGGDASVNSAVETLTRVAQKNRIPVFSNVYGHAKSGTLFDLGANYHEVGRGVGALAVRVLRGESPADIEVTNVLPERILINHAVLRGLRDPWHFPESFINRADETIDANGVLHPNKAKL